MNLDCLGLGWVVGDNYPRFAFSIFFSILVVRVSYISKC